MVIRDISQLFSGFAPNKGKYLTFYEMIEYEKRLVPKADWCEQVKRVYTRDEGHVIELGGGKKITQNNSEEIKLIKNTKHDETKYNTEIKIISDKNSAYSVSDTPCWSIFKGGKKRTNKKRKKHARVKKRTFCKRNHINA